MSVDLSKLRTKSGTDIDLKAPGVSCLARIALRKSWSKNASYWIDIVEDDAGFKQVYRSWSWGSGSSAVEGCKPYGHKSSNPLTVESHFYTCLGQRFDNDYEIEGFQSCARSPVDGAKLASYIQSYQNQKSPIEVILDAVDEATRTEERKQQLPKLERKPRSDWW